MKTLFIILIASSVAGFLWISSSSTNLPSTWSIVEQLEYRWYVFKDKLGIEMGVEQRARFRKMINEAINTAREITSDTDVWLGRVYPDREDMSRSVTIGHFETLEACRSAAYDKLSSIGEVSRGDYECGRSCKLEDAKLEIWVCDEVKQ